MGTPVTLNSVSYTIPAVGEDNWGSAVSAYLIALSTGVLSKAGGSFTLTADTDFGTGFGLKAIYYKSRGTVAGAGILRLANNESIGWRNAANSANLELKVNTSNILEFNGNPIPTIALGAADTILQMNGAGTAFEFAKLNDANVDASAAIAYSKLDLADSIVNADIDAAAAIAYSKLDLADSIIDADIDSAAAIAYSKLNLAGEIVNADINASAAIAYSKLNLATSIVNADVSASAAIAYSKLNLGTSIVNADVSASAAIAYSKLALTGAVVFGDLSASSCTIDEDTMSSDSAVRVPTQQSVKAYVDTQVAAASSVVSVNNAGGDVSETLTTADDSAIIYTPTVARTIKLDNSFSKGREMLIINDGTAAAAILTVTANDDSVICQVYPKCRQKFLAIDNTPGLNTTWKAQIPIRSEWDAVTVTSTWNNDTIVAYRKREGDTAKYRIGLTLSGAHGGANLIFTIPNTIDTNKVHNATGTRQGVGSWEAFDGATTQPLGRVTMTTTTTLTAMRYTDVGVAEALASEDGSVVTLASGDTVFAYVEVPISGWGEFTG